jgi:hypothetical protein
MMRNLILLPLLWVAGMAFGQSKYPVIKATSTKVSINDGGIFEKNAWRLSPKARPDIYTADRTRKNKWVIFYTDMDSIRVRLKPGQKFDFIILLNGKDSCFTRIASAIPPEEDDQVKTAVNDTVPFTLTNYDAISFKAVINNTDTVNLHFDTGSWGLRLTKEAIVKKTKLLAGSAAPDFSRTAKVFKLQIGKLAFDNPDFAVTDRTAHGMDGRFGWDLFEGKQVELNYDQSVMIIHSGKFAKISKGYIKSDLAFKHSFLVIKGTLKKGDHSYPGDFLMDTGSEQAIILDSAWAASVDFAANLKLLRSVILHNPKGTSFETRLVVAPSFTVDGFQLTDIPSLVLGAPNPAGFPINDLGNDVLKRFNMVLDFKNDKVYLKRNHLMNLKYREHS